MPADGRREMDPGRFRVVIGGRARRAHRAAEGARRSAVAPLPRLLTADAIDRRLALEPVATVTEDRLAIVIGQNVERWRRVRGWTQEDLAGAVGCNRSAVSRWEAGRRLPSLPHLLALGDALGCGAAALLPNGGEKEGPARLGQ